VTIDVVANDTDPDGNLDPTTVNVACPSCAVPSDGSLVNNGDGSFDYTPDADFTGSDSFVYEICDSGSPSFCDTATVSITVNSTNDPPVANDDSASTSEDTTVTIDVVANDTDPDGNLDPTTVNVACPSCAVPSDGSLVGSFDYTPDPDFNGSDSFVYEICDSDAPSLCDTATVSITVSATNDPPVANDDSAWTSKGTAVAIDVAANDTDPEGNLDVATANTICPSCALPNNGSLVNYGDGTFDYTPEPPGFTGSDGFVYEICDSDSPSLCDTATVSITVSSTNDPPVANDDSAATLEDVSVTVDVAANDTDPDGNLDPTTANVTCASCALPSDGSLVDNGDGTFDYTPNPDFNGSDGFVYEICDSDDPSLCDTATVSITVTPTNDPPVANDDGAATSVDTTVTVDVAANDMDPDGNLDVTTTNTGCLSCSRTANGLLINDGDGTFVYTPDPGFSGSDGFVYEICDSGAPSLCDTATVTVTVSGTTLIEIRVSAGTDDAEEKPDGVMQLASSDLDLAQRTVGLRFTSVNIPQGAGIVTAFVQFQTAGTNGEPNTAVTIHGQLVADAPTFTSADEDISSRGVTAAFVLWDTPEWTVEGEAGPDQRTPDLRGIIQEIVNQPDWVPGNALVIRFAGTGDQKAESYEGLAAAAPQLHVEYGE
jgi:hypothetical protein